MSGPPPPPMLGGAASSGGKRAEAEPPSVQEVQISADAETAPKRMKLGFSLLQKAGYKGVGGLGKRESGRDAPVEVKVAPEQVGLGYVEFENEMNEEREDDPPALAQREMMDDPRVQSLAQDVVVVRVLPAHFHAPDVLELAQTWGPVMRFAVDRKMNAYLQLSSERKAKRMVAHYKANGLKLYGTTLTCFVSTAAPMAYLPDYKKEASMVETPKETPKVPEPDALSMLMGKLNGTKQPPVVDVDEDDEDSFDHLAPPADFIAEPPPPPDNNSLLKTLAALNNVQVKKKEPAKTRLRVLEAFVSSNDSELGCKEGEILEQLQADQGGWTEAQNTRGDCGFVPTSYVERVRE